MQEFRIEDAHEFVGKEVTIKGWLYNKRSSGKIKFLLVRDGSGIMQCVVVKNNISPEKFELSEKIGLETSLMVRGKIKEEPRAIGGYEMEVIDFDIYQPVYDYPISKKEHGIEFLMEHRHLWIRSRKQHAILKIRHEIIKACRDYFDMNGYTLVDTPIFTPSACEGTTTLFETKYFDTSAYLTQSGQLYNEATAAAFGKVYCFGPTFRAEKSKTRRHLMEFWMVEPEIAWADLNDVMDVAEDFIVFIVKRVLENRKRELEVLERDISKLEKIEKPFPRITYGEAVEILKKKGVDFKDGDDFGGGDETVISESFEKPVMVHRYPIDIKAFYMQPDPEDENLALCVDVLAPEGYGEIIGGGQRIDDYELLLKKIKEHNLPVEAFKWYLDIRKYGTFPHGGFGMGIERCVAWICGIRHVRETIAFPRTLYRIYP